VSFTYRTATAVSITNIDFGFLILTDLLLECKIILSFSGETECIAHCVNLLSIIPFNLFDKNKQRVSLNKEF